MAGQAGRLIALAAVAAGCGAAVAYDPVKALAGRYNHRFENGTTFGESYWSDDVVEIAPVDPRHAYVRFELNFYNGHSCSLAGVAKARGDALIYLEPADKAYKERCRLEIRRDGAKLRWDDDGSCHAYCGARGGFSGGEIAWSSKRPIRYIAVLKRSDEYRRAMIEWKTGKAAPE